MRTEAMEWIFKVLGEKKLSAQMKVSLPKQRKNNNILK